MASTRTSRTAGEARTDDGAPSGDVAPVVAVNGVEPDTSDSTVAPGPNGDDIPKMSELTGIRYVGMADTKILTKVDLEAMGVESPKGDLTWNAENNRLVQSIEFNADTRDVLLADRNFLAE